VSALRRLWSETAWSGRVGLLGLAVLLVVALLAPVLAAHPPDRNLVGPPAASPSPDHFFGTDEFGRDVFSRVLAGARVSAAVAASASVLALLLGALAGAVTAAGPRFVRGAAQRVVELLVVFPAVVLAVALAGVLGPSLSTTIVVATLLYTPAIARVVRANVLAELGKDYATSARASGAGAAYLVAVHVARNVAGPVLVFALVLSADAILLEAALSFLGLGVQPPTSSWGTIVSDGRGLINSGGWWVSAFGGLAIFGAVLSLNLAADGLSGRRRPGRGIRALPRAPRPSRARAASGAAVPEADGERLLAVEGLRLRFPEQYGAVDVVADVSFSVRAGSIVGLVGESGSGKTLVGLTIMGLLPRGAVATGAIRLRGRDLMALSAAERRRHLGRDVAMVYQDPLSALNPGMTAGAQLRQLTSRGGARTPAQLLEMVQLSRGALTSYPHQLSGGQRQRVILAMALSREPSLLVADEPTTALDVTVQAQIVQLLQELQRDLGFSVLLISHDIALVSELATQLVVLYAGQVVETGSVSSLLERPTHPYTRGLVESVASLEAQARPLAQIGGTVPSPADVVPGCRFAGRCSREIERCSGVVPEARARQVGGGLMACHNPILSHDDRPVRVP